MSMQQSHKRLCTSISRFLLCNASGLKKTTRCHRKCPQAALSASLPGSQVPITETETIQLFADEALSRNGGNVGLVLVLDNGDVDGRDVRAKGFPARRKH